MSVPDADVEDGGRNVLAKGVGFFGALVAKLKPPLEVEGDANENAEPEGCDPNGDMAVNALSSSKEGRAKMSDVEVWGL